MGSTWAELEGGRRDKSDRKDSPGPIFCLHNMAEKHNLKQEGFVFGSVSVCEVSAHPRLQISFVRPVVFASFFWIFRLRNGLGHDFV